MDVYRSLAAILGTISSSSSLPSSLIAAQLSTAPKDQKPELARLLAQLLRTTPPPDSAAQEILHGYIHTLLSSANLSDASQDFKLAVELAGDGLLQEILEETQESLTQLLHRATEVNASSDEAFALDIGGFSRPMCMRATETSQEVKELDPTALQDAVIRRLRFWHFLFIVEGRRRGELTYRGLFHQLGEALPAALLMAMALRRQQVADAASNALCHFVNEFYEFLPEGSSEVMFIATVRGNNKLAFRIEWNRG
jgi:hypothetical protein